MKKQINLNYIKNTKKELQALNFIFKLGIPAKGLFELDNILHSLQPKKTAVYENNLYIIS